LWNNRHKDAWTAVLFFWAGKTSPRELEEFVSDLVARDEETETLLAVSLLDDQGDRLAHEVQRTLALRLLQCAVPRSGPTSSAIPPTVPAFVYTEVNVHAALLWGLSGRESVVRALAKLLANGVLVPDDMSLTGAGFRDAMTVAMFWTLSRPGTRAMFDALHSIKHLASREVALLSFGYFEWATTADAVRGIVADWLASFPENRQCVALLLAGVIVDGRRLSGLLKRVCPVLWEWRDEPVSSDWLRESDKCRGWRRSDDLDLLTMIREIMKTQSPDALGIGATQHTDLLGWCDRLLAERAALKAGATGTPAQ
jgi:hypothetical protein